MTSAPRSPRSRPANGPASSVPSSITRTPASGPGSAPCSSGSVRAALRSLVDSELARIRDEHVARLEDVLAHHQLGPLGVAALQRMGDLLVVVERDLRCSGEYQMYDCRRAAGR